MSEQTSGTSTRRPPNILIVDDSAMMRAMIRRATSVCGVPIGEIYEAADGREALALLEAKTVDALFTDINMPVMSGTELLRAMEKDGRWTGLLRVIISTDGSAARRAEADALHVRLYVEKPFRPEAVRDVLSQLATNA